MPSHLDPHDLWIEALAPLITGTANILFTAADYLYPPEGSQEAAIPLRRRVVGDVVATLRPSPRTLLYLQTMRNAVTVPDQVLAAMELIQRVEIPWVGVPGAALRAMTNGAGFQVHPMAYVPQVPKVEKPFASLWDLVEVNTTRLRRLRTRRRVYEEGFVMLDLQGEEEREDEGEEREKEVEEDDGFVLVNQPPKEDEERQDEREEEGQEYKDQDIVILNHKGEDDMRMHRKAKYDAMAREYLQQSGVLRTTAAPEGSDEVLQDAEEEQEKEDMEQEEGDEDEDGKEKEKYQEEGEEEEDGERNQEEPSPMEDVDLGDQADSGQEYWHDGDYDGICDFELEDFPIDVENAEEEARRGSGVG